MYHKVKHLNKHPFTCILRVGQDFSWNLCLLTEVLAVFLTKPCSIMYYPSISVLALKDIYETN